MKRLCHGVRLCAAFCAALFFSVAAVAQIGGPILGGGNTKVGGPFPGAAVNAIPFANPANILATDPSNFNYVTSTGIFTAPTITATTKFLGASGGIGAPTFGFSSDPTTGLYSSGAGVADITISGTRRYSFQPATLYFINDTASIALGASSDLILARDAANTLAQKNGANDQIARRYGGNGGFEECGSVSENLTLSTGGTTTDTAANLLPANANIKAVTARVTTTVATATSWQLGDATITGRFTAAQSGAQLTSGATVVGLVHIDQTGTSGPRQSAAAKIRVTTVGTPSAGAIRITSYYCSYTPATS